MDKSDGIPAIVFVFGKNFVVFGQGSSTRSCWLYSGISGCFRAKVVVFGQSGCIRAKVVIFGQRCCNRAKVIVFWQSGCILEKVVIFG